MAMNRRADLDHLYHLLSELKEQVGGMQTLAECNGRLDWPEKGIYIFFAPDEVKRDSDHPRITRIGTHAVSQGSGTTLWNRLIAHRGTRSGKYANGGNHRGSVFRLQVGEALLERDNLTEEFPKWGQGSSAGAEIRERELAHERRVSEYIRSLPFLWIKVDDEPGPESNRAYLERNLIALVSNYDKPAIDPRNDAWPGNFSQSPMIRKSGLWNVNHVNEPYDPAFLHTLGEHISVTSPL